MKLKISAFLACLSMVTAGLNAQAKPKPAAKPAAPAAPAAPAVAKPAVAAPAAPAVAAPAKPAVPAVAAPAVAAAEEAPAPVEGFFVKKVKSPIDGKEITLRVGGYADAYFGIHTRGLNDIRPNNHPAGPDGAGTQQTGRIFEAPNQQFSLGLVQTKFEAGNEDWQVVADLVHGPNAELTNFSNFRGIPAGTGTAATSTTSTAIKQAYVAANIFKGLKLTAGQFGTHIGYEVVESYLNPNYMLGNLFAYGPFYHTGAKLDYSIMDGKIGFMAGAVNGWDLQYDNNKDKTVIGQISLKPTSSITVYLNYAGGNETSAYNAAITNVGGMRHIGDLVAQYQVMKGLKVGVNVVYGENKESTSVVAKKWGGAAVYISYLLLDGFTLSYRADYFDDRQGARGLLGGAQVLGNTLTGTISMYGGHILIRPEVKYDLANNLVYGAGTDLTKHNVSGLIAVTGVY